MLASNCGLQVCKKHLESPLMVLMLVQVSGRLAVMQVPCQDPIWHVMCPLKAPGPTIFCITTLPTSRPTC